MNTYNVKNYVKNKCLLSKIKNGVLSNSRFSQTPISHKNQIHLIQRRVTGDFLVNQGDHARRGEIFQTITCSHNLTIIVSLNVRVSW